MMYPLLVSEVFGPTVQGEGPRLGQRASFIRLGGCNLSCVWCDSQYTWNREKFNLREELMTRSARDVVEEVTGHGTRLVVITGGEPLLQQNRSGWAYLIGALTDGGKSIEIETNGTKVPVDATLSHSVRFNVSPKLAHAGDFQDQRLVTDSLRAFSDLAWDGRAIWKFVAQSMEDVEEIVSIVNRFHVPSGKVWVMPEGVAADTIQSHLSVIADASIAAGFNLTTRLHVLTWGQERKR